MEVNVAQLQPPPPSPRPIQRSTLESHSQDASFLNLRQLSTRKRVRISPANLNLEALPGKAELLASANSKGWFAAAAWSTDGATRIVCSPLADLRSAFSSSGDEEQVDLNCKRTVSLSRAVPCCLVLAWKDERLLVGLTSGSVLVFDTAQMFREGNDMAQPLFTIDSSSPAPLKHILANPGDAPELVAIMHEAPGAGKPIQILDLKESRIVGGWHAGNTPETTPTTISWSPKGKQLAVGLHSGDIVTYDPRSTSTLKSAIHRPPAAQGLNLLTTVWLANPTFYAVYAALPLTPDTQYSHFIITHDSKAHTATDVKLNAPIYPFPGLRPSSIFMLVLRNWEAAKFLLFIGDSASSDVGVVGAMTQSPSEPEGTWCNLGMDEGGSATLPLDKDQNDTVLSGLTLDLTNATASSNHSPTMYAFASDGTVIGWHIVYAGSSGYPDMINPVVSATAMDMSMSMDSRMTPKPSSPKPSVFGDGTSAFSQADATLAPSTSAFGQTSAVGASSPHFSSRTTPAFGQSGFGSPSSTNTFGQPQSSLSTTSPFGGTSQASPFGLAASPAKGFGGFNSSAPATFGQTSFGFGQPAAVQTPRTIESDMTDASGDGFGGLSLGTPSAERKSSGSGIFGSPAPLPLPPNHPSNLPQSAFSSAASPSSSFIKPATGFGAFPGASQSSMQPLPSSAFGSSGFGTSSSSFLKPATGAFPSFSSGQTPGSDSVAEQPKASAAFGASGFASAAAQNKGSATFGTTGFTKPMFGQPAFGQPSFANPASPTPAGLSSATPSGFSAFASGGTTSFALAAKQSQTQDVSTTKFPFSGRDNDPPSSDLTAAPDPPRSVFGDGAAHGLALNALPPRVPMQSVFGGTNAAQSSSDLQLVSAIRGGESPPSSPEGSPPKSPQALPTVDPFAAATTPQVSTVSAFGKPSSSAFIRSNPSSSDGAFGRLLSPGSSPFGTSGETASGAFGGLKTAPSPFGATSGSGVFGSTMSSVFRPAEGFGAFGGASRNSAYANPKPIESVSAFSRPNFSSAPSISTASGTPVFGHTSLGPKPQVTVSPKKAEALSSKTMDRNASAFTAFSSQPSAFNAFATTSNKSAFVDLLRGDGEKSKLEEKNTASQSSAKEPTKNVLKVEDGDVLAKVDPTGRKNSATAQAAADDTDEDKAELAQELMSASAASSFVKVSPPLSEDETEPPEGRGSEHQDEEDEGASQEDDIEDFLSDHFSPEGSGDEDEEDASGSSDDEDDKEQTPGPASKEGKLTKQDKERAASPSRVPLPDTPKDEKAEYAASLSPSLEMNSTTTPPGSPVNSGRPPAASSPVTMAPLFTPSTPFAGLGLGRPPSTRPTRSSPLAGMPVSRGESDEDEKPKTSAKTASMTPSGLPARPLASAGRETATSSPTPLFAPQPMPASSERNDPKTLISSKTPSPATVNPSLPGPIALSASPFSLPTSKPPSPFSLSATIPSAPATTPSTSSLPPPSSKTPDVGWKVPLSVTSAASAASSLSSRTGANDSSKKTSSIFSGPSPFAPSTSASLASTLLKPTLPSPLSSTAVPSPLSSQLPGTVFASPPTPSQIMSATDPVGERGIQVEFLKLFGTLNKELEELKNLAEAANKRRIEIYQSSKFSHTKVDLADQSKWVLGDIKTHGQLMKILDKDLDQVRVQRDGASQEVKYLETGLIRGMTRQEEIEKFTRAREDPEFAKMLKARTLGPEHLEAQEQLRRDISITTDRVQKLEDHLQASKRKVAESKSGKPNFRPPTIDTIHRTFRNIDAALAQQSDAVARLTDRVAGINLSSLNSTPPYAGRRGGPHFSANRFSANPEEQRNSRRRTSSSGGDLGVNPRPRNLSPRIMSTTAAALNAERAAARLKKVLLTERAEPLYNTRASKATRPVPQSFQTPEKPPSFVGSNILRAPVPSVPMTPLSMPSTISFLPPESTPTLPVWALPNPSDDAFRVSESPESGGQRSGGSGARQRESRKHGSSVPLKRSVGSPGGSPGPAPGDSEGGDGVFAFNVATVGSSTPIGPGTDTGGSFFSSASVMPTKPAAALPSPSSTAQPVFDWGPLPGVKPRSTLSADVRGFGSGK